MINLIPVFIRFKMLNIPINFWFKKSKIVQFNYIIKFYL